MTNVDERKRLDWIKRFFVWTGGDNPEGFAHQLRLAAILLIVAFTLLCVALGWSQSCNWGLFLRITVAAMLTALASACVGAILGLMFGLPRSIPDEALNNRPGLRFLENTNLLEIADWLTKIIVGVSLVELRNLPSAVVQLGTYVAPALTSPQCGASSDALEPIGIAGMLAAGAAAALIGYLWTRVTFTQLLVKFDRQRMAMDGTASDAKRATPGPDSAV